MNYKGIVGLFLCLLLPAKGIEASGAASPIERPSVPPEELASVRAKLEAPQGLYPASLAIRYNTRGKYIFFASAVLVAPEWAIITAHDLKALLPYLDVTRVFYGNTNYDEASSARIIQHVVHEAYTQERGFSEDIALIKLERPLDIKPIQIVDEKNGFRAENYRSGEVVGWGTLTEGEAARFPARQEKDMASLTDYIKKQERLEVEVIPTNKCRALYSIDLSKLIKSDMICAQSRLENVDVCSGFGGAPLMVPDDEGRPTLLGIVSWGAERCGANKLPTVYTNVSTYISWIESKIGKLSGTAVSPGPKEKEGISGRIGRLTLAIAPRNTFRFMVSIEHSDSPPFDGHFCGGSLISRRWVLTAAHCIWEVKDHPEAIKLKVDAYDLTDPDQGFSIHKVKRIIPHEHFERTVFGNFLFDIALLELGEDIPIDVKAIKLLSAKIEDDLLNAKHYDPQLVGFGLNGSSPSASPSSLLQRTKLKVIPNTECEKMYSGIIQNFELCAGLPDADACQGDSGGPLVLYSDEHGFSLLGVVSWGPTVCASASKPGVYMRVSRLQEWIDSHAN